MKTAFLFIPAYHPPAYVGATPSPYQSGIVDTFEAKACELCPMVFRHANATQLAKDPSGRFAHPAIVTPYEFGLEEVSALGKLASLALRVFKLESINANVGGETTLLNIADAKEIEAGTLVWPTQREVVCQAEDEF